MARKDEIFEALVWLARWFGGRRERLWKRILEYEARVTGSLFLTVERETQVSTLRRSGDRRFLRFRPCSLLPIPTHFQ